MAGYIRQSTYTDGDIIDASDSNDEFDQLLAAFNATSGHTHDGTAAEGAAITKLLSNTLTFGAGSAGTDITITFDGESNDGVLKWMEDEDYFEFSDDLLIASTEKVQIRDTGIYLNSSTDGQLDVVADGEVQIVSPIVDINASTGLALDGANLNSAWTVNTNNKIQFRDTGLYINSSTDGQLDIVADTEIQIAATTIDMNGAADISGNLAVGGTLGVTGVLTGSSLDISGDIDVDGTTNLDAVDIDGAVQLDATLTVGANDQGYDVILYGDTASANMTWDTSADDLIFNGAAGLIVPDGQLTLGSTAVTSTAAELNLLDGVSGLVQADLTKLAAVDSTAAELNIVDGGTSATSTTVVDADRVVMNDNGTMVQVAVTDLAAYFDDEITAMPNLVSTGALNTGSITSGFGTIDTGASNITTTGVGAFGSLDISGAIDVDGTTNLDVVDIDGAVNMATTLLVTGVATLTATPIANAGISVKNGATSAGFVEFFEDSDNGTNKVTLIGPASTADITLTLPTTTGTLITSASAIDEATALAIALG